MFNTIITMTIVVGTCVAIYLLTGFLYWSFVGFQLWLESRREGAAAAAKAAAAAPAEVVADAEKAAAAIKTAAAGPTGPAEEDVENLFILRRAHERYPQDEHVRFLLTKANVRWNNWILK